MLKVLIADDHAIVRKGLKEILRAASEATTVGEASDGSEALAQVSAEPWDVVILDITMPGQNGLEVLKVLKRDHPKLPVVMLSMHSGYHYVMGSLKAGASGYLNKETAPEELVTAIRTAIDGGIYVSRSLAESLDLNLK
ncbi:MAG TPA: response regulator transcription factor [Chloroflexia bacterium]|nr:response regulator transcription factor [Chloroflexia bacterium]